MKKQKKLRFVMWEKELPILVKYEEGIGRNIGHNGIKQTNRGLQLEVFR